jgi:hypothetical protein
MFQSNFLLEQIHIFPFPRGGEGLPKPTAFLASLRRSSATPHNHVVLRIGLSVTYVVDVRL